MKLPRTRRNRATLPCPPVLAAACRAMGLPVPLCEVQFHPTRRWRLDYLFADKVALEVEGGVFRSGGSRHTRGAGFRADLEKYAELACAGIWLIRCLPEQLEDGTALAWVQRVLAR
jgi:hypothetical protein